MRTVVAFAGSLVGVLLIAIAALYLAQVIGLATIHPPSPELPPVIATVAAEVSRTTTDLPPVIATVAAEVHQITPGPTQIPQETPTTGSFRPASNNVAPFCATSDPPTLPPEFAALKRYLKGSIGDPIECAHAEGGDVVLHTSTSGLAYVRSGSNVATFTTGSEHWATLDGCIVYWTGPDPDPAQTATKLDCAP